jgi:hypothetical protein
MNRLIPTLAQFGENGFASAPAAELVAAIESTAEGCRWLLGHWDRLRAAIDREHVWTTANEMILLRLRGENLVGIDDPAVLDLLVASRVYQSRSAKLDADNWEPGLFPMSLCTDALREACLRRPTRYEEAYRILGNAIEQATMRLKIVLQIREREGDNWGSGESARIASFDASNEGERLRRYQITTHREMIRTVESVMKMRLQAAKLEKEERALGGLRNEANSRQTEALGNEPNVVTEEEISGGTGGIPTSGVPPTVRKPIVLRNEPNFDLDGVEWIEIPPLGRGVESALSLQAAS